MIEQDSYTKASESGEEAQKETMLKWIRKSRTRNFRQ